MTTETRTRTPLVAALFVREGCSWRDHARQVTIPGGRLIKLDLNKLECHHTRSLFMPEEPEGLRKMLTDRGNDDRHFQRWRELCEEERQRDLAQRQAFRDEMSSTGNTGMNDQVTALLENTDKLMGAVDTLTQQNLELQRQNGELMEKLADALKAKRGGRPPKGAAQGKD